MKLVIRTLAVTLLVAAPMAALAQTSQPVTRAQVENQLAQLEQAGYNPNDWMHYTSSLPQAEMRVARQNSGNTAYGGANGGTSQAGK
ncbi:DUF4148 domain-containing protein [Paraburkholderia acidipaludis]|uniref:DUF4148 domain-containing protein n=1 Tax=Paraburkholderia acidipaludis TaxID=660537 RepID=UPI0005BCCA1B|nr:DUF4148 domain-containing protein [Paraburkholderia acidipaludis]